MLIIRIIAAIFLSALVQAVHAEAVKLRLGALAPSSSRRAAKPRLTSRSPSR